MLEKPQLKHVTLETERLYLKEMGPGVMYTLFSYYTDEEIKAFMGLTTESELEMERMKFEGGMTTYRSTFKSFFLVDKISGKTIGRSGFHNWYAQHFRAEIGYVMSDERYLNKGLMTEANRALIEYGFDKMDLNRIEAFTAPHNEPSKRMLKKLGFKEEGHLRQHFFKNNRLEDSLCFGLLKKEYFR